MKKTLSFLVIALALVCIARPALALPPVFSSDLNDYVATLDYDATANNVGLVLEIQLAQDITLAAIPTLETTYTGSPWPVMFPATSWSAFKDDSLAMSGIVLGMPNGAPMKPTCTLLTAATADKGDKIRCTRDVKFNLNTLGPTPPMTIDEFKVWLEYYFIVLASGMDPATHTATKTSPLNVSAMVARGAAVAPIVEEEEEDVVEAVEDVCDTSVDPDCDGVIGDADLCPDEFGDSEDGCPLIAVPDEGGAISDGGGCSLIIR